MKCQPETGAGPGGTATRSDALLIKMPFPGFAPHKLQSTRSIMQGCLYRRHHILCLRDVSVIDRNDRDPCLQVGIHGDACLISAGPAAAVDEK